MDNAADLFFIFSDEISDSLIVPVRRDYRSGRNIYLAITNEAYGCWRAMRRSPEGQDDMCEVSLLKRSPTYNLLGWFGKASHRAMQAMKSFITCSTLLESDDNFSEYLARIFGEPNADFSQHSQDSFHSLTGDACSSFRSEVSFSRYFANALRNPSPLRLQGGDDQAAPVSQKACTSTKFDDSLPEYLANATRQHDTVDFGDNRDETVSTCSLPRSPKADVNHVVEHIGTSKQGAVAHSRGKKSLSACSTAPQSEATTLACGTPPDVWSNRNGRKFPIGFCGKLDANTSSRLADICMSEVAQLCERPPHPVEETDSAIPSAYVKVGQCECIGETMISSVVTAQPKLPANFYELPIRLRFRAVKQFLSEFEYRQNSLSNFQIKKQRPLSGLMATAKLIIHQPEPIRCVEAVFVALYLTAGLQCVERVPLGFKTQFANQEFQHIVLLVQHKGKYGAFGMSRSPDLMNKDICFNSMSSIIEDFKIAYEESDHTMLTLQIGLPVEHDILSSSYVCWEHLCLCPATQPWPECVAAIENHALRMKHLWNVWMISGRDADPTRKPFKSLRKAPLNSGANTSGMKLEVKKASGLRKSSVYKNRFNGQPTTHHSKANNNRSYAQKRNAPVPSILIDKKIFPDPRDPNDPWTYTQGQGTKCSGGEHSAIHSGECGSIESNAWEACKFCDCGKPLCEADPVLLSESPKSGRSGPLYNMALKRARVK